MRAFITIAAAISLMTGIAIAQDATPADDSQAWFASPSVLTQKTGKGIYDAVCASCHMPQGEGAEGAGRYPALAENPMIESTDYVIYMILHGGGAMPSLKDILDDEQVAEVVNYVQTNFGNDFKEDPATAERVAASR